MTLEHTTLLNGRVSLHQPLFGLRASTDSVLLAASVEAKAGEHLLDMGCGAGGVGLCALARHDGLVLSGVDIQSDMIDVARKNAPDHDFKVGDIADKHLYDRESFDHIVMNPPYFEDGKKQPSLDPARDVAFRTDNFDQWMASALHWVKQGGSVSVIHKADMLGQILSLASGKFGAIEIWPVHSKSQAEAIRVVIRMRRNRKTPLTIHPAVILFDDDGTPSARSNAILRDGAGLIE